MALLVPDVSLLRFTVLIIYENETFFIPYKYCHLTVWTLIEFWNILGPVGLGQLAFTWPIAQP